MNVIDVGDLSMRVLVVEDDKKIAAFVTRGLKEAGFAIDHADDGEDGAPSRSVRVL